MGAFDLSSFFRAWRSPGSERSRWAGWEWGASEAARRADSRVCAQHLQENSILIEAVLQNMNAGRIDDAIQYQLQLQQNLLYLGTIADEQPNVRKLTFAVTPASAQVEAASETSQHCANSTSLDCVQTGSAARSAE